MTEFNPLARRSLPARLGGVAAHDIPLDIVTDAVIAASNTYLARLESKMDTQTLCNNYTSKEETAKAVPRTSEQEGFAHPSKEESAGREPPTSEQEGTAHPSKDASATPVRQKPDYGSSVHPSKDESAVIATLQALEREIYTHPSKEASAAVEPRLADRQRHVWEELQDTKDAAALQRAHAEHASVLSRAKSLYPDMHRALLNRMAQGMKLPDGGGSPIPTAALAALADAQRHQDLALRIMRHSVEIERAKGGSFGDTMAHAILSDDLYDVAGAQIVSDPTSYVDL